MSLPIRGDIIPISCTSTCNIADVEVLQSDLSTPALPFCPSATQQHQRGFRRISVTEEPRAWPFHGQAQGVLEMRVKEGSKIRNLLGFATARMRGDGGDVGRAGVRQVVFTGSGMGVTKTITCAEILKRKLGGLHQLSRVYFKTVEEVWEDVDRCGPRMSMQKTVPAISILLSKDLMDPQENGYQAPKVPKALLDNKEREGSPFAIKMTPCRPCLQHVAKRVCLEDPLPQTSSVGFNL